MREFFFSAYERQGEPSNGLLGRAHGGANKNRIGRNKWEGEVLNRSWRKRKGRSLIAKKPAGGNGPKEEVLEPYWIRDHTLALKSINQWRNRNVVVNYKQIN